MNENHLKAQSKKDVAHVVRSMLDGSVNYLRGAQQLIELREDLGIYANDPDFVVFLAVLSEIDCLRDDNGFIDWEQDLNPKMQKQMQESIEWAKDVSWENCLSLVNRYGSV